MQPLDLLIIDDSEGDILLVKAAIEERGIAHKIDVAKNGIEALKILKNESGDPGYTLPQMILLDINMPMMNGLELLDIIKADPNLKHIPVIMLTTSSSKTDILKSYQRYSNCYIIKPDDLADFDKVIVAIENFWMNTVALPSSKASTGESEPRASDQSRQ